MPGDLEGSPALTFAPLDSTATAPPGSLARMMERRYEAYKTIVVRPFFRDHFARLDRQIVLVDALQALNGGAEAVADLETALADVLSAFRLGSSNWLSGLVFRKIDRILFAATKADHLHHDDHDRLEAILARLVGRAMERAKFAGATVDVLALASVRATREGTVLQRGERLALDRRHAAPRRDARRPPLRRQDRDRRLSRRPAERPGSAVHPATAPTPLRFVRFRPPKLERTAEGLTLSLPHIRLDRALEFLIGDRLA